MKRLTDNKMAIIASLINDKALHQKYARIWIRYEDLLNISINRNGKKYTLEKYKTSYVFLRNLVLHLPTQPMSFTKVDKRGIPKPLWPLRPLIKRARNEHRLALTIARSYEKIKLPIEINVESIVNDYPKGSFVKETTKHFSKFLEKFFHKYPWYLGTLVNRSPGEPRVFTSTAKGPNGSAVACSHLDARAVCDDETLYNGLSKLNKVLGQEWITHWMELQASYTPSNDNLLTGRLGFSSEAGGKTRTFAIGDYWSQTSLKIIQISLYNTLKQISTDSTKNQDKGFKTLIAESLGKPTFCFDLSSASDRIPAEMQKFRLCAMGGHHLGDAWHQVMTQRDFYIKDLGTSVRWKVGQPLGLLSSFPSFALWHHDIIQYAANFQRFHSGKPLRFFKKYRLLGDDVVIFDAKVAETYQQILRSLGIPINLEKSVIGDVSNSQIEFTKRLSLNGLEMSSIKYNILSKTSQVYLVDLVDILIERDIIPDTGHYGLYDYLSSKGYHTISMMLWFRSNTSTHYRVNDVISIARDDLAQRVKEKRHQNILEKSAEIQSFHDTASPNELYNSATLPRSVEALGLSDGFPTDNFVLHPLVWAINQVGLDLFDILTILWDESEEISPVEFIPNPSPRPYFHSRKSKGVYLSKIIIDSFNELVNECQDVKLKS